jgi:hypothetical protein
MDTFKVGEKVVFIRIVFIRNRGYWGSSYTIEEIERETKTQYVISDSIRIRKEGLRQVGDQYSRIEKLTAKWKQKIELDKKLSTACSLMDDIGRNRNHIKTTDIESIGKAIGLMYDVKTLLSIKD